MNVHTKPESSVTMSDPQEIVAKIAGKYASAEKHLRLAHAALSSIPALYEQVHESGVAFGYLEMLEHSARAQVNAGLVGTAALAVAQSHRADTKRAQELDIDLPSVRSGGGR
jgi:hypothetical protein